MTRSLVLRFVIFKLIIFKKSNLKPAVIPEIEMKLFVLLVERSQCKGEGHFKPIQGLKMRLRRCLEKRLKPEGNNPRCKQVRN
jgi:hypothetical protein